MQVLDMTWPSTLTGSTHSTKNPILDPMRLRKGMSPRAFLPKEKSWPTTRPVAPIRRTMVSFTKTSGWVSANSRVNGAMMRQSMPRDSMAPIFSSRVKMSWGVMPLTTEAGCGWKVNTTDTPPMRAAWVRVLRKISWWPRWQPSKLPMVTTALSSVSGKTASVPVNTCIYIHP
ncbi:MAG: hypothetical protein BWX71_02797 [Deltaproteobacteria bacterium ADurb.Bin072]|nr:MAG: hypothetical protein BWX71_02797 [Deltaproteobacteria bacterium ADurb.Bin072]